MNKVFQYDLHHNFIREYKSLSDAARDVGVDKSVLSACCKGKRNTARGFIWSYNELCPVEKEEGLIWRPIKKYNGEYEISNDLNVRTKGKVIKQKKPNGETYERVIPPKVIVPYVDTEGYYACSMGNNKTERIHRLFYETFIGEIPDGMIVDHINRNKLDNTTENLRLVEPPMSIKNRTLAYKPDITDCSKYQKYKNKEKAHPFLLRFSENGKRYRVGYFSTYEEAEEKYRELYNERQKRIDYACS